MPEPFEAIGFQIKDAASYEALAEEAHQRGNLSRVQRSQGMLLGCCWNLGSGLEVWTMLFESSKGTFYADCRPAFRGQRLFSFYPWEILEYEEDGEAIARGLMPDQTTEIMFALQNITEIDPLNFRERPITAAVSGLAYRARIISKTGRPTFASLANTRKRRNNSDNDYIVRGEILSWREINNAHTKQDLICVDVNAGIIKIEIVVNRADLRGELKRGASLSADIWLQGHILNDRELLARYEGIDQDVSQSDVWIKLRRDH